jgi:hypothetical protein
MYRYDEMGNSVSSRSTHSSQRKDAKAQRETRMVPRFLFQGSGFAVGGGFSTPSLVRAAVAQGFSPAKRSQFRTLPPGRTGAANKGSSAWQNTSPATVALCHGARTRDGPRGGSRLHVLSASPSRRLHCLPHRHVRPPASKRFANVDVSPPAGGRSVATPTRRIIRRHSLATDARHYPRAV